jgi:hypothetical protein
MGDKAIQVKKSSFASRIGFALVALLCAIAAGLHIHNWLRGSAFNMPVAVSMTGLTILMLINALEPPRGPLRLSLAAIALLLVFGGFIAQFIPALIH